MWFSLRRFRDNKCDCVLRVPVERYARRIRDRPPPTMCAACRCCTAHAGAWPTCTLARFGIPGHCLFVCVCVGGWVAALFCTQQMCLASWQCLCFVWPDEVFGDLCPLTTVPGCAPCHPTLGYWSLVHRLRSRGVGASMCVQAPYRPIRRPGLRPFEHHLFKQPHRHFGMQTWVVRCISLRKWTGMGHRCRRSEQRPMHLVPKCVCVCAHPVCTPE